MTSTLTSSKKREATASNVGVGVSNVPKRTRYIMEDDADSQKETFLRDRLNVASKFGEDSNVDQSTWFSKRSHRIESVDAVVGTAIVVPVDLPDVGESADEVWAHQIGIAVLWRKRTLI